jgi:hypothetical protein
MYTQRFGSSLHHGVVIAGAASSEWTEEKVWLLEGKFEILREFNISSQKGELRSKESPEINQMLVRAAID